MRVNASSPDAVSPTPLASPLAAPRLHRSLELHIDSNELLLQRAIEEKKTDQKHTQLKSVERGAWVGVGFYDHEDFFWRNY